VGSARYPSDAFYHEQVMAAGDVLDVGCGTGSMLCHARAAGHAGRLAGLDPDAAALERARRRADIEWVLGVAADAAWDREFDLATMASHAFQFLVSDDVAALGSLLDETGFKIEAQHGDWVGGPITPESREIVAIARRR
jgi:ubiquinone/menaquinone biosynthesis C-methylase UbiE